MPFQTWTKQILQQIKGVNPFEGDCLPSRVGLGLGRPTAPIRLPWNYKEPIKIFEAFYSGTENLTDWGKHNRYRHDAQSNN